MFKKLGLVFLAVLLMIGIVASYHWSQQVTPEEEKTKTLSYIEGSDLINKLGAEGFLKLWSTLPLEEKKALMKAVLSSEDAIDILGPEGITVILSQFQLTRADLLKILTANKDKEVPDKTTTLIGLTDAEPDLLKATERKILVEVYDKEDEWLYTLEPTLAMVYKNIVIAPIAAFYRQFRFYVTPVYTLPDVKIKAYLLPDPNQEPKLAKSGVKEELGEVKPDNINERLEIVTIKRVKPVINITPIEQYLGEEYKFEKLLRGRPAYQITQDKEMMEVFPSEIQGFYRDEEGRNLIDIAGDINFGDLGGLAFASYNGQLRVIGVNCVIKPMGYGKSRVYALDINQIIIYIEEKILTKK